jgi:hypothetical protein
MKSLERSIGFTIAVLVCLLAIGTYDATAQDRRTNDSFVGAGQVIRGVPSGDGMGLTDEARASAVSRLPIIRDRSQLPPGVREAIEAGADDALRQGYGTAGFPFTTKRAGAWGKTIEPIDRFPWRAAGKLWMRFGTLWYVCSASVIEKGLVVTAAHCVFDYGQGPAGWADEVYFEPARHRGSWTCTSHTCPFGTWTMDTMGIATVYYNGTDVCLPGAEGIVCENDLAVLVMDTDEHGRYIGDRLCAYGYKWDDWGYADFLDETATQLTELGYPVAFDKGYRMIRTDSLGVQDSPSQVVIGSDQTGGSSGGPWLMNFGVDPESTSPTPLFNDANQVVAVTSWGYVNKTIKVQGASRFARNTTFTTRSNIETIVDYMCNLRPTHCY